jgi:hypothetical protein
VEVVSLARRNCASVCQRTDARVLREHHLDRNESTMKEATHMSQTIISPEFGSSTTDRLASMAHETIDRVTPKVNRAEHEVRGAATKAADEAKLMQEQGLEAARENLRKLRSYAETNPLVTAGIAFAAGALLCAWVRR